MGAWVALCIFQLEHQTHDFTDAFILENKTTVTQFNENYEVDDCTEI